MICHDLEPSNPDGWVVVETANSDGTSTWLADFKRDELKPIENG